MFLTCRRFDLAVAYARGRPGHLARRERTAAHGLLRRSQRARTLFADALAAEPSPGPDECAVATILIGLRRRMVASTPTNTTLRWGALAPCAMAGLMAGQWLTATAPDAFQMVQAAALP